MDDEIIFDTTVMLNLFQHLLRASNGFRIKLGMTRRALIYDPVDTGIDVFIGDFLVTICLNEIGLIVVGVVLTFAFGYDFGVVISPYELHIHAVGF